jgi:hypothetical protein
MEAVEHAKGAENHKSASERAEDRLNNLVAITVALLATFMGILAIKGDNVGQAINKSSADRINSWSWYQARNIRQEVMLATAEEMATLAKTSTGAARGEFERTAAEYRRMAASQEEKKKKQEADAKEAERNFEMLNRKDDQIDMADAVLSIAIALLALTALTKRRLLYAVSLIPIGLGVALGLAALLGWEKSFGAVEIIAKWLGA